jgi:hypothetical protein
MHRDTDSTDIPTVRHELKLEISPTSVGRLLTVSVKCRSSVMCSVSKVSVGGAKRGEREVSVKKRKKSYFEFRADDGYSSDAVTLLEG